jgi:hypothetical protein
MSDSRTIDYQRLLVWRRSHPAWRLLLADHAPMIASFLHDAFIAHDTRGISRQQLATQLEDHLFHLHDAAGEILFPKAATAYLDDWASDLRGWLRKYYPAGLDESHYDLTPSGELALHWLAQLEDRPFIGTEARMSALHHALEEIVDRTELMPRERIARLRARKADIDAEIAMIEQGRLELMESAQIRDRVNYASETLRGLLSDLRAVEQNFRQAGRAFHERLAAGQATITRALHEAADPIAASDEGASFALFRHRLASPANREELTRLLDKLAALAPILDRDSGSELRHVLHQLRHASETSEATATRIARQLRRQQDESARLESRRLMQLLRGIEQKALTLRERAPTGPFIEIDEPAPTFALPMDRTLFNPPFKPRIRQRKIEDGADVRMPASALFARAQVDPQRLAANVRETLRDRAQATLADVLAMHPVRHGLAELAAYLELAAHDLHCAIDEERTQVVHWSDVDGKPRQATLPLVIYTL